MTLILNTFMTENFQYNEKTIKIKKDRVHVHSLSLVKVINNESIIVEQNFTNLNLLKVAGINSNLP